MNYHIHELSYTRTIIYMNYHIHELSYTRTIIYMNYHIHELSYTGVCKETAKHQGEDVD